jgi:glycosyltransferase involved in cell wall biosynthesis
VITGLGFTFIESNKSVKFWCIREGIKLFYKMASKRVILIAQNWDDLRDLEITEGNYVINGSGVCGTSTKKEVYVKNLRLLYVGRLLKSKGVMSAFELFQKVIKSKPESRLTIVGTIDLSNPDSIDKNVFDRIIACPNIDYLGYIEDIDTIYENHNVLLFPSMYREGIPRVILESLRHGLTILTYNRPGCRETIEGNGLLINPGEFCDNSTLNYILSLNEDILKLNSVKSRLIFDTKFTSNVIYPEFLERVKDQI